MLPGWRPEASILAAGLSRDFVSVSSLAFLQVAAMFAFRPVHLLHSQAMEALGTIGAMTSDFAQSKIFGWPQPQPILNKIDTHHHIVPDFYAKGDLP